MNRFGSPAHFVEAARGPGAAGQRGDYMFITKMIITNKNVIKGLSQGGMFV